MTRARCDLAAAEAETEAEAELETQAPEASVGDGEELTSSASSAALFSSSFASSCESAAIWTCARADAVLAEHSLPLACDGAKMPTIEPTGALMKSGSVRAEPPPANAIAVFAIDIEVSGIDVPLAVPSTGPACCSLPAKARCSLHN